MSKYQAQSVLISYDLGTGGAKAALYSQELRPLAKAFVPYETLFPSRNRHEQRPGDWLNAVKRSTARLLAESGVQAKEIAGVALSGASCAAIPMGADGNPLLSQVPIWSDTCSLPQTQAFFREINEKTWYETTGGGFPAPCYPLFKLMRLKLTMPEILSKTAYVLGTKDYINYILTGVPATDFSYASGTGAYCLADKKMLPDYLKAAGLKENLFLNPIESHAVIGRVTKEAAAQTGLIAGTPVLCGGVDNACMALGAAGAEEGKAYISLGFSAWTPVNSKEPVTDFKTKPYTFAHIDPDMFTSAYSIFAAGSALKWARDTLFSEYSYTEFDALAMQSAAGANGVFFQPGLAGGTSQDKSPHLCGAFAGLRLGTSRADLARSVLEGVALNLCLSMRLLRRKTHVKEPVIICGGGSKSAVWPQIFADVFGMKIEKTNIDEDAAAFGAAAIAARGLSIWRDYSPLNSIRETESVYAPDENARREYLRLLPLFESVCAAAAKLGDKMHRMEKL